MSCKSVLPILIGSDKQIVTTFYYFRNQKGNTHSNENKFRRYSELAENGNDNAQFKLGNCYQNGIGTTKDEEKAFQWTLNQLRETLMDKIILDIIALGPDIVMKKGLEPLKMSPMGQYNLEYYYYNGIGTTKDKEKPKRETVMDNTILDIVMEKELESQKNEEKAFQWYMKSVKGGNLLKQYNLGHSKGGNFLGQYNIEHCFTIRLEPQKIKKKHFNNT
ncbi:hypothetical protein Glove_743g6 [Diversispora epigaea]|uniref:Uncharacterized protein n=1 Tax=Diversispora epigaea TaxID=1348612 RepID=A0A397G5Y1_9GLOM|nr:hypothetical protein Glove_743g6 [Diversispora epigaea]